MTTSGTESEKPAHQAQMSHTELVDASNEYGEAVGAPATGTGLIHRTNSGEAKAAGLSGDNNSKPKYHISSLTESYDIFGVDAIWHNQYAGPESDFLAFRKRYDCDVDAMVLLVGRHVSQGLYFIISMNATPHCLTVICGCTKMLADMPDDMFDDPSG